MMSFQLQEKGANNVIIQTASIVANAIVVNATFIYDEFIIVKA